MVERWELALIIVAVGLLIAVASTSEWWVVPLMLGFIGWYAIIRWGGRPLRDASALFFVGILCLYCLRGANTLTHYLVLGGAAAVLFAAGCRIYIVEKRILADGE